MNRKDPQNYVPPHLLEGMKHCNKCCQVLPRSAFYFWPKMGFKISSACRECRAKRLVEWRESNPGRYASQKARAAAQLRKGHHHLRQRYGLTMDEFNAIATKQNWVCAICGCAEVRKGASRLSVDHDHKTGRVRELLCHKCNLAVGAIKENVGTAKALVEYLVRHSTEEVA